MATGCAAADGKGAPRVNKQQQVCAALNEIRIRNEREKEKKKLFKRRWWGSYMGEVKELHEGERHGKYKNRGHDRIAIAGTQPACPFLFNVEV
jgi:hypothetical protein